MQLHGVFLHEPKSPHCAVHRFGFRPLENSSNRVQSKIYKFFEKNFINKKCAYGPKMKPRQAQCGLLGSWRNTPCISLIYEKNIDFNYI